MLAQNFLSHETLGVTQEEWAALIKVLGMLERGELVHRKNFRMDDWDCGTAACIGGWADRLFNVDFNRRDPNAGLDELFMATGVAQWGDITEEQAAIALRNYLTTGRPRWAEAVAA